MLLNGPALNEVELTGSEKAAAPEPPPEPSELDLRGPFTMFGEGPTRTMSGGGPERSMSGEGPERTMSGEE